MQNTKIILFVSLFTAIILTFFGTGMVDAAQHDKGPSTEDSSPSWVMNIENRGGDPTIQIGYGCTHGHMNFSCD